MIAKQLAFQLLGQLSLFFPKEMRSGTARGACIKENEKDCVWVVVMYEK
jgi:hypothetical protein